MALLSQPADKRNLRASANEELPTRDFAEVECEQGERMRGRGDVADAHMLVGWSTSRRAE